MSLLFVDACFDLSKERIKAMGAEVVQQPYTLDSEKFYTDNFQNTEDFYKKLKDRLSSDDFVTSFNRRLYQCLCEKLDAGVDAELSQFAKHFSPEEMDSVTRIFISSSSLSNTVKECEDCIDVLKEKVAPKITDTSSMSDEEYLKLFKKN